MSRHYAATKETKALLNKHKAVVALQCLSSAMICEGKLDEGILKDGDISWETLLRAQLEVYKAEELVCTSAEWCSVVQHAQGYVDQGVAQLEDVCATSTSPCLPFMFKLRQSGTIHMAKVKGGFIPRC